MARPNSMTMVQAIEKILTRVDGPMPVDAFIKRVLAMYRSTAKNPIASVRNKLRTECVGENIVFRDRQTLEPLRLAMQGVRFRIRLTQEEVTQEVLFVASAFEYFQRGRLEPQKMRLQDVSGHTLPCQVKTAAQQVKSVLGTYPREAQAFAFGDWYRAHQVEPNDSVLVTIVDWNTGHFQLEHEPANRRRQADITRQNQELADAIYAMLESASSERIYPRTTIPTAYARLSEPRAYPGDHWTEVLAGDDRMFFDGFFIRYGGVGSIFEGLQELVGIASQIRRRLLHPLDSHVNGFDVPEFNQRPQHFYPWAALPGETLAQDRQSRGIAQSKKCVGDVSVVALLVEFPESW